MDPGQHTFSQSRQTCGQGKHIRSRIGHFYLGLMFFSVSPMPVRRHSHGCGLVNNPNQGPEIIVAGGYQYGAYRTGYSDTADIYTINTDTWRGGKSNLNLENVLVLILCMLFSANNLPKAIYGAAAVPYQNSFLLVGGQDTGINSGDIYQYNAEDDEWIEMVSKLVKPRYYHAALVVRQSLFPECSRVD